MKQSEFYSKCGIIDHPITKIITNLKSAANKAAVVVCATDEIFDEAMTTIMNRFPQATGLVLKSNPGAIMGKRDASVSIYFDVLGCKVDLKVMTDAEYQANKATVDALALPIKTVTFSGGQD